MRRFLVALVVFGAGWYSVGAYALEVDKAEASTVLAKCARSSPAVPYPHWKHTKVACQNPGWWIRVRSKFARRIGTYPVVIADARLAQWTCVDLAPKISRNVGRRGATSSWVPRRGCLRHGIG